MIPLKPLGFRTSKEYLKREAKKVSKKATVAFNQILKKLMEKKNV